MDFDLFWYPPNDFDKHRNYSMSTECKISKKSQIRTNFVGYRCPPKLKFLRKKKEIKMKFKKNYLYNVKR